MGLQKSKELKSGFAATYWRVTPTVTVDLANHVAYGRLLAYKDKTARDAGKDPVELHDADLDTQTHVTLDGADFEAAIVTGDLRAAMYTKVKTKDFFQDATDVLES